MTSSVLISDAASTVNRLYIFQQARMVPHVKPAAKKLCGIGKSSRSSGMEDVVNGLVIGAL